MRSLDFPVEVTASRTEVRVDEMGTEADNSVKIEVCRRTGRMSRFYTVSALYPRLHPAHIPNLLV